MKKSLYGWVVMLKGYCKMCKTEAFVIDKKLQCCNADFIELNDHSIKRESEALSKRLPKETKERILKLQEYKCFLCGVHLNSLLFYKKGNSFKKLRIEYDHFIPKSFCSIGDIENIFAMCNLCNSLKGSKMFETFGDAKQYIIEKRQKQGTLETYTLEEKTILKNVV